MIEHDGFSVTWDKRGFLVLRVKPGHVFDMEQALAIAVETRSRGIDCCGLLVEHVHEYELARTCSRAMFRARRGWCSCAWPITRRRNGRA